MGGALLKAKRSSVNETRHSGVTAVSGEISISLGPGGHFSGRESESDHSFENQAPTFPRYYVTMLKLL